MMRKAIRIALRRFGFEVRRIPRMRSKTLTLCETPTEALHRMREGEKAIINSPTEMLLRPNGWKFGPSAWNPFTEAAREILDFPGISYAESVLCQYYRVFQPNNAREAVVGLKDKLEPLEGLSPLLQEGLINTFGSAELAT